MIIKLTKSRIDKGLLAIPVSLVDNFPDEKTKVLIFFDDSDSTMEKKFTPYRSRSRECRIYGMREYYERNNIENGDEIEILSLGRKRYRIKCK